jgi:hypothetical protein
VTTTQSLKDVADAARRRFTTAMRDTVRELGGDFRRLPVASDHPEYGTFESPEPIIGLRVVRQLELAAKSQLRKLAEQARADGRTWREIGDALGITVSREYDGVPDSIAERAFDLVAQDRDSAWARDYGRSVLWQCGSCNSRITDRGPELGNPHEMESGHADGCARFAADVRRWDASWADD